MSAHLAMSSSDRVDVLLPEPTSDAPLLWRHHPTPAAQCPIVAVVFHHEPGLGRTLPTPRDRRPTYGEGDASAALNDVQHFPPGHQVGEALRCH